jgi:hypothetical protein
MDDPKPAGFPPAGFFIAEGSPCTAKVHRSDRCPNSLARRFQKRENEARHSGGASHLRAMIRSTALHSFENLRADITLYCAVGSCAFRRCGGARSTSPTSTGRATAISARRAAWPALLPSRTIQPWPCARGWGLSAPRRSRRLCSRSGRSGPCSRTRQFSSFRRPRFRALLTRRPNHVARRWLAP